MKKLFSTTTLILAFSIALVSCKNNETNATESDAQEVAEASDKAEIYTIDTDKSVIHWKGEKPTGIHTGTIKFNSGQLLIDDTTIEGGKVSMDMKSLTVTDLEGEAKTNLEGHLKGTTEGKEGDFFNTNQYPNAHFEITAVSDDDGEITINGNLSIKDKAYNIEIPAVVTYSDDSIYLESSSFMIDRTKWDINFMSKSVFDDLGNKFINDEVELRIELYASK